MSVLRAKCPDCGGYTAVALGPDYQCHSCGREFAAGLVRVPRAWGAGGESMAEAAKLELPYPEAGIVDEDSLAEQSFALALALPERPLVLGGCCCAHIGAVEGLGVRHGRIALVWLDAHGDLNTPASSPSGNPWGMPLRTLLDTDAVRPDDVLLVGARSLDPPEREYIETSGIHTGAEALDHALAETDGVYVALDCDALEPDSVASFMPEPGGLALEAAEELLRNVSARANVLGAGFSGLRFEPANVAPLTRLASALGI